MTDLETLIEPRLRPVGDGMVRRLLPWRLRRTVGPFIFADLMGPTVIPAGVAADVEPHPHIGLATVTHLFEGRIVHRDSTGAVQAIEPGAVNWMTSGAGVVHSERSHADDVMRERRLHGLQTWVALPDGAEDQPPAFHHHPRTVIPEATSGGATIRLIAGTGFSLQSPVQVSSPLILAELTLNDGARVAIDDSHPERALLAVDGDVELGSSKVPAGHMAVLKPGSRPTLSGLGRVMMLGGEPVGRRHIWWNFVHSDPGRIEQAKRDWADNRFDLIPGDQQTRIPLPQ